MGYLLRKPFAVRRSEQNRGVHVETFADKPDLSRIRKQIRFELNSVGAPAGPAFDCLVAVTEAATNALLHGVGEDAQPPEISWKIDPGRARFLIRDYSGKEGAEPPSSENEDHPRDGGYGLAMMRRLMDAVDIRFSPDGTTVSMEKRF